MTSLVTPRRCGGTRQQRPSSSSSSRYHHHHRRHDNNHLGMFLIVFVGLLLLESQWFHVVVVVSGFSLIGEPSFYNSRRAANLPNHPRGSILCMVDEDYNYDLDEDDDEDDEPPEISGRDFKIPKVHTFGLNRGRSSPNLRKAMGTSSKGSANVYVCTNCGGESVKWMGRCPTCREWNTLQEFKVPRGETNNGGVGRMQALFRGGGGVSGNSGSHSWLDGIDSNTVGGNNDVRGTANNNNGMLRAPYNYYYNRPIPSTKVDIQAKTNQRLVIPDDNEFNTVLGGGFMPGSLLLLGGDPGVGKSTLALQIAALVANQSKGIGMGFSTVGPVWYVSGEETLNQVATRAQRLDALMDTLLLVSETNLNQVAELVIMELEMANKGSESTQTVGFDNDEDTHEATTTRGGETSQYLPPSLLIVDSLQTMVCDTTSNYASGGIAQARECMSLLLRLAKITDIPILVIGHVTKSGDVAGPRMVEHMVDAVLYLEHSAGSHKAGGANQYRWLRAVKNRFGSCDNVGLYSFEPTGRLEPSPELLASASEMMKQDDLEGCSMAISLEGNQRAMLVEVQALVTPSSANFGKKTVEGGGSFSYGRLNLLIGVLQKHCLVNIGKTRDVYVNVISNAAASTTNSNKKQNVASYLDLAVSVALTSSLARIPVRGDTVFLAQVGLLGELRTLPNMEIRLQQAQRMGFSQAIVASSSSSSFNKNKKNKARYPHQQQNQYKIPGMEIMECSTLKEALQWGLTASIPKNKRRRPKTTADGEKASSSGDIDDFVILDDEDYDDF